MFDSVTERMVEAVWEAIDGDGDLPGWLVKGRMVLIPKEGCTGVGGQQQNHNS